MKYLLSFSFVFFLNLWQLPAQPQTLKECNEAYRSAAQEIESLQRLVDSLQMLLMNNGGIPSTIPQYDRPTGIPNQINDYSQGSSTSQSNNHSEVSNLSMKDRHNVEAIKTHVEALMRQGKEVIAMKMPFFGNNTFNIYIVDLKSNSLVTNFFWKGPSGNAYRNLGNLKMQTQNSGSYGELLFATNGGMFNQQSQPKGLLVIEGDQRQPLDRGVNGYGNFYLQPNGVFLLQNDNTPRVVKTSEFDGYRNSTRLATQSGPMLVTDGQINPLFDRNSRNKHIRSGVGIINDRYVVFIKTQLPATFYETAVIFKEAFGCQDALFLDGAISKFYCPHPEISLNETDGFFGTLIGIYRRK